MTTASATSRTARMYTGLWGVLVRYFRVPENPPEIPGKPREAHQFKPSQGFLDYLKLWFWIVLWIIDLSLLACWIIIFVVQWWVGLLLTPIALAVIILPDIFAYIAIHLRYDTTWYVLTERAMRIRRGIWIIEERTITYENIQNVKVTQGPVQRHFGIADVVVETAGAAATTGKHGTTVSNQGRIEGVSNAQEIRDRVLAKMRESQSAGLGDEETRKEHSGRNWHGWTPGHRDVLRQLREELAAINSRTA